MNVYKREYEVGDLVKVVEYSKPSEMAPAWIGVPLHMKHPVVYGVVIDKTNPQGHKPYHVLLVGKHQRKEWFFASHMCLIS